MHADGVAEGHICRQERLCTVVAERLALHVPHLPAEGGQRVVRHGVRHDEQVDDGGQGLVLRSPDDQLDIIAHLRREAVEHLAIG